MKRRFVNAINYLILACLLLFILSALPGCALFQPTPANPSPIGDQLLIQEATAVAIQAGCSTPSCYTARAGKIVAIATVLETVNTTMALNDLNAAIQKELVALKLTPEEIAPIGALNTALINYLTPLVGASTLNAQAVAIINKVAGWIAETAGSYSV